MELLKQYKNDITQQMRKAGFKPERIVKEMSFAKQIWDDPKNSFLRKSEPNSVLKSIVNIAQIGLTLNPVAKEAFLIPRYDKYAKGIVCHLEPSYVGMVKLLTDAGSVTSINTQLVYSEDYFEMNLAGDEPIIHRPAMKYRGELIGVYSIAKLVTGEKQIEWMDIEEVNKVRDTSDSYRAFLEDNSKPTVWNTWYGEMVRKTCLKRAYKYLPRTDRMEKVDTAIELSNVDFTPSVEQTDYAIDLIRTSTLIDSTKDQLEREIAVCNTFELSAMIQRLLDSQPEPIESGDSYNQTDINARLDYVMSDPKK